MYILARVWRSEDNLGKLVLSLHQVGPKDRTQAVRLGSRHPLAIMLVPLAFAFNERETINALGMHKG